MGNGTQLIALPALGIVRMRGPDAARFLQGQLSNDIERLSAQGSMLAGYHNPQGRAIALLHLVQWAADDILAVVPRELASTVSLRLSKFVLRAKVKIADESQSWRIDGLVEEAESGNVPPRSVSSTSVQVAANRWLLISAAESAPLSDYQTGGEEFWRSCEVAAGQPQVYNATSEEFVAQMLNLDVLNAIAFDKGCYTGQEVIARAHYRGRVKRRMQRFVSREPCELVPGQSGQLTDGRAFKIVQAVRLADGRIEFLAVAPLVAGEREPAEPAAPGTTVLAADPMPLPYSLPD